MFKSNMRYCLIALITYGAFKQIPAGAYLVIILMMLNVGKWLGKG
jgi:hypothetical protein